jgi:glycosyltransferase involved in cell wall biosynthesis
MKKIFVISSREPSSWKSCETIESNLIESYRFAYQKNFSLYLLGNDAEPDEKEILIKKIRRVRPDTLVFISQKLPLPFIQTLATGISISDCPELVFHIYGNFILHIEKWLSLEPVFLGRKVRFLVASERYQNVLKKLIPRKSLASRVCPFPVSPSFYSYQRENRSRLRKKLGYSDDEFVIGYAGRISLQKNVDILLNLYQKLFEKFPNKKLRLVFCGIFDDSGFPNAMILPFL